MSIASIILQIQKLSLNFQPINIKPLELNNITINDYEKLFQTKTNIKIYNYFIHQYIIYLSNYLHLHNFINHCSIIISHIYSYNTNFFHHLLSQCI
jgi:hypothetical protein